MINIDTHQTITSSPESTSDDTLACSTKELYRAPQMKVHGKLERLTLQGGGSGSTGDPNATPTPDPLNP